MYKKFFKHLQQQRRVVFLHNLKSGKIMHRVYGRLHVKVFQHNIIFFKVNGQIQKLDLSQNPNDVIWIEYSNSSNFIPGIFNVLTSNAKTKAQLFYLEEQYENMLENLKTVKSDAYVKKINDFPVKMNVKIHNVIVGPQYGNNKYQYIELVFNYTQIDNKVYLSSGGGMSLDIGSMKNYDKVFFNIMSKYGILIKNINVKDQEGII